jgi:hypothetical protein
VAPVVIHVQAVSNPPNGQNASALADPGPDTALDQTIQAIQATITVCTACRDQRIFFADAVDLRGTKVPDICSPMKRFSAWKGAASQV